MSLELNKVAAAVLTGGIVAMLSGFVAGKLYHPETLEEPAYKIALPESGGGKEEAPKEQSILPLIASADVEAGKKQTSKCSACHTFTEGGADGVGPNLWNIVGSEPAHVAGYSFSDALVKLKDEGKKWDYENLSAFLTDPKGYAPGTKMAFAGLRKIDQRADVIAYLRTLSSSPVPLPPKEEAAKTDGAAEEKTEGASETAAAEAPKAEESAEAPKAEETATAAAEAPKAEESAEAPKVEETATAAAEAPKAEESAEAPKTEETATAAAEAPKAEESAEAPKAEETATAAAEAPKAEESAEAPKAEETATAAAEAPKAEESAEAPKAEETATAAAEAPKAEEAETASAEAPKEEEAAAATDAPAASAGEAQTELGKLLANANIDQGKKVARKCSACHTFDEGGKNRVGPNLYGIIGKTAGEGEGFKFSKAMAAKGAEGYTWTYEHLDQYLANPRETMPGNKMTFPGLKKPQDRADVIAYIRSLAKDPPPLPN